MIVSLPSCIKWTVTLTPGLINGRNRAAVRLGQANSGWRELYDGFVPDFRLRKQFAQGLRRWWSAELKNLTLSPRRRATANAAAATAHPSEA